MQQVRLIEVFGIDFPADQIVMANGQRFDVDKWYSPIGQECDKSQASVVVFQGPHQMWFAVDVRAVCIPEVVH